MSHLIATFFYIGHLRPAPGTWGSLAALLLGYVIVQTAGVLGLCMGIMITCIIGWWATAAQTKDKDDHDPSEIVIDEVVGQWIAILPIAMWPHAYEISIWYWFLAFAGFRMFDIIKPGLVGWADRQVSAIGVMLDDIIAGLMTAASIILVMIILS